MRAPVLPWRVPTPLAAALVASGLLFNGYDSTAGQAWCCLVNAVLLQGLLLGDAVPRHFWRRAAPVLVVGAAGLGWAVAVTVTADGALPDYAPGKILSIVAGWEALLAGALIAGRSEAERGALVDWLLGLITADLVLGLALRGADAGLFSYWTVLRDGRFQGTVGNINVTAAMAGAAAVIACHRGLAVLHWPIMDRRRTVRLAAYGSALVLCAGVVLLTASRVPSLLLLAALGHAVCQHLPGRRWDWSRRQGIAAAAAVLILLGLGAHLAGLLGARFDQAGAGWADRMGMWDHYLTLALDQPLTGYGLGSFPSVNTHFLTNPRFAQATWANNSPHDVVLQLMLGGGLPYAAATLAAAAIATLAVVRQPRAAHGPDRTALIAAVALIVGCATVDVVLDMPASASVTLFLAGLLWGDVLSAERNPHRRGGWTPSAP